MPEDRTSRPLELLLPVRRGSGTLRAQLERQLREAVRSGRLRPGSALPSTRALAEQLGVSRGVVVEVYDQLAAEGYLVARQGSATRVADAALVGAAPPKPAQPSRPVRYDFRPGVPALDTFPRSAWLASLRKALLQAPHAALGYGDPRGQQALRQALVAYLGRVRGVAPTPSGSWSARASPRAPRWCAGRLLAGEPDGSPWRTPPIPASGPSWPPRASSQYQSR